MLLIDRGADVNAKDNFQQTPLYTAAIFGNIDTAKLLIDRGADVNSRDQFQKTLHIQRRQQQKECCR